MDNLTNSQRQSREQFKRYRYRLMAGISTDYLWASPEDDRDFFVVTLPSYDNPKLRKLFVVVADNKEQAESAFARALFTKGIDDWRWDPEWDMAAGPCRYSFSLVVFQNETDENPAQTMKDFNDWLNAGCPGRWVPHENTDDASSLMDAWQADWQNTLSAWLKKAKSNKDTQNGDVRMITSLARSVALRSNDGSRTVITRDSYHSWPDRIHEVHFSPEGRLYSKIEWCEKVIAGDIDPRIIRNFGDNAYARLLNYLLSDFDT